jgi:hypothetical protein
MIRSALMIPAHLQWDADVTRRHNAEGTVIRAGKIAGSGVTSRPIMTTIGINCVVKIRVEN